jgi:hypothetical protein
MLLLIGNVGQNIFPLRCSDRKSALSLLPGEGSFLFV